MALVDVHALTGHHCEISTTKRGDEYPHCICGWKGPSYGAVDHGSVLKGIEAHLATAPLAPPVFVTDLHRYDGSPRRDLPVRKIREFQWLV